MNSTSSKLLPILLTAGLTALISTMANMPNVRSSAGASANTKSRLLLAASTRTDNAPGSSIGSVASDAEPDSATLLRTLVRTNDFIYTGGVVFNTELPGRAGQLILNVYVAVDSDGTGLGTLSDVVNREVNSHLTIDRTDVKGNEFKMEGVVLTSNTAEWVGRPFIAAGVVSQQFTSLVVSLDEGTFTGKGFFVSSPKFRTNDFRVF